jgi:hypothetical protein
MQLSFVFYSYKIQFTVILLNYVTIAGGTISLNKYFLFPEDGNYKFLQKFLTS